MKWAECQIAEDVLGYREKPFLFGGHVEKPIHEVINESEYSDLNVLLSILVSAATIHSSELNAMLVGSVLAGLHRDIDLLVCTDPANRREDVVAEAARIARLFPFRVTESGVKGSAPVLKNRLFTRNKLFAMSEKHWHSFDISFVGDNAGSWQDVLDFHAYTHLSHFILV